MVAASTVTPYLRPFVLIRASKKATAESNFGPKKGCVRIARKKAARLRSRSRLMLDHFDPRRTALEVR
jgi:hypothetical protein